MNHCSINYGEVLDIVLALKGITLEDMVGDGRMPRIVEARRMFACTMHSLHHSYPDIAKMICRPHHSSTHGMVQYVKKQGYYDKVVYTVLRLIYEKRLGQTTNYWIEKDNAA